MAERIDALQENALTTDVREIITDIQELKSSAAQLSDSTGIIFYSTKMPGTYDWSGSYIAPPTSQSLVGPILRVTVTSIEDVVLLADLIVEDVKVNSGTPPYGYQPPRRIASNDPKVGLWEFFVGVPLNMTSTVDVKFSVVANTDVSLSAVRIN